MAFGFARHPNLVMTTSDAAVTGVITAFEDAYGLSILAPSTTTSTAIYVQVAQSTATSATFARLQSGGSNVTIAGNAALVISPVPFQQLRLETTGAEATAKTFEVSKVFLV